MFPGPVSLLPCGDRLHGLLVSVERLLDPPELLLLARQIAREQALVLGSLLNETGLLLQRLLNLLQLVLEFVEVIF